MNCSADRRWIWIVLDSVGVGAAPDAHQYGPSDEMSHTLGHIAAAVDAFRVPHLQSLGLGCIAHIQSVACTDGTGAYGKMREQSFGKDTTNGHWEFVGVVLRKALPVYPDGFPDEVIRPFEAFVGKEVLCNRPASGTEVIEAFGQVHIETGRPIVYTSADSVFQVAAHESIVPVDTLYDWCEHARRLLIGRHGVGRVIARPFIGESGTFQRTDRRKDFSLSFGRTVLNDLVDAGVEVTGVGKIGDIYGHSGITRAIHTVNNDDGMHQVMQLMDTQPRGLIYANLVDFDALYGHRNNPVGFARAVERFDQQLGELLPKLRENDILVITADHGCDPTVPGTDHTREYVPLLVYRSSMTKRIALGERSSFADIGATIAGDYGLPAPLTGESFLGKIMQD